MGSPGWAASSGQREIMMSGPSGPAPRGVRAPPGTPRSHPPLGHRLKKSGCFPASPTPWGKGNEIRAREVGTGPALHSESKAGTEPRVLLGTGTEGGLSSLLGYVGSQRGTWRGGSCPELSPCSWVWVSPGQRGGCSILLPKPPPSVQKPNLLRGGLGRMQRLGLPAARQPPHPPTSSGLRLGRNWGHQVSRGMRHREQCLAQASFPESACPCLVTVSVHHTHTHSETY